GRITAAARTGPASGPRPASSMPATSSMPRSQKLCSRARSRSGRRRSPWRRVPRRVRPMRPRRGASALAPLLDPGRLAAPQTTQVVQLRPTDPTAPHHLDRLDRRRVQREDPLDADAARDLAHGEALADPCPAAADAHPLEGLDPLLVTLTHAHVHA